MKSILKNISLDFLTGLKAITIIFIFVQIIPVSKEILAVIVGIVYLIIKINPNANTSGFS